MTQSSILFITMAWRIRWWAEFQLPSNYNTLIIFMKLPPIKSFPTSDRPCILIKEDSLTAWEIPWQNDTPSILMLRSAKPSTYVVAQPNRPADWQTDVSRKRVVRSHSAWGYDSINSLFIVRARRFYYAVIASYNAGLGWKNIMTVFKITSLLGLGKGCIEDCRLLYFDSLAVRCLSRPWFPDWMPTRPRVTDNVKFWLSDVRTTPPNFVWNEWNRNAEGDGRNNEIMRLYAS